MAFSGSKATLDEFPQLLGGPVGTIDLTVGRIPVQKSAIHFVKGELLPIKVQDLDRLSRLGLNGLAVVAAEKLPQLVGEDLSGPTGNADVKGGIAAGGGRFDRFLRFRRRLRRDRFKLRGSRCRFGHGGGAHAGVGHHTGLTLAHPAHAGSENHAHHKHGHRGGAQHHPKDPPGLILFPDGLTAHLGHYILMKTLGELSDRYKKIAEEELKKDYEMMEQVPKSVWKKADRKYCYSLYAVDIWSLDGRIFSFTVQEGHSNSLGVGEDGYGRYRSIRYNIDVETGEILTLADLFNDKEALYQLLLDRMLEYGTHNDVGRFIHSDGFPAALRGVLDEPEPNGIGCNIRYKYLELWMPLELFPMESSQLREVIYYEDIQDILNDKYASVK